MPDNAGHLRVLTCADFGPMPTTSPYATIEDWYRAGGPDQARLSAGYPCDTCRVPATHAARDVMSYKQDGREVMIPVFGTLKFGCDAHLVTSVVL